MAVILNYTDHMNNLDRGRMHMWIFGVRDLCLCAKRANVPTLLFYGFCLIFRPNDKVHVVCFRLCVLIRFVFKFFQPTTKCDDVKERTKNKNEKEAANEIETETKMNWKMPPKFESHSNGMLFNLNFNIKFILPFYIRRLLTTFVVHEFVDGNGIVSLVTYLSLSFSIIKCKCNY